MATIGSARGDNRADGGFQIASGSPSHDTRYEHEEGYGPGPTCAGSNLCLNRGISVHGELLYPAGVRRFLFLFLATLPGFVSAAPVQLSGIYPHLAFFNEEDECGTGAVVPFADRLWVVTYAPHRPRGSTDQLYEITPNLRLIPRPESIGGTPANRMIHRESNQLFIGPHVIDAQGGVRTLPYSTLFGRPTGNARHLTDPARKIYTATMEEGFYEVDVDTLEVKELWRDEQLPGGRKAGLPGYHGKGLYSGQGVLVYANNGEHGPEAQRRPDVPSGVLAEWDGRSDAWTVIRRNQFTEVTGPGGIHGNANPDTDPIWTVGWDHRSLLLLCRHQGTWHTWRLPKGSHSYDGAHGWNTEWPRIREIGEEEFLMTMHGTFWRFPPSFNPRQARGIRPRSNYLKVIGDFCRWQDRLVFGCDDTARNEFLNKRRAKGTIAAPQSQSNLWFVEPSQLDHLGPALGRGAVWLNDTVAAHQPSEAFLFAGYHHRGVHLSHGEAAHVRFTFQVDVGGDGFWQDIESALVPPGESVFVSFPPDRQGEWIRVRTSTTCVGAVAMFTYRQVDPRTSTADPIFHGLAEPASSSLTGGLVRARAGNTRTLAFAAQTSDGQDVGYYELDGSLQLQRRDDPEAHRYQKEHTALPVGVLTSDAASVMFTDDNGHRWRLPKGDVVFDQGGPFGNHRVAREVATERDLFHAHGTFYELPANNAGGFARIRPVATHNRVIHDFCSYRGLLILSGVVQPAPVDHPHLLRSDDGRTALWAGAVDDLWKLGKPRGTGGPWHRTEVRAGQRSDPYLMTGYDRKQLKLTADREVMVTLELEIDGGGTWVRGQRFRLTADRTLRHTFPESFSAYWIRFSSDTDATLTAVLEYD